MVISNLSCPTILGAQSVTLLRRNRLKLWKLQVFFPRLGLLSFERSKTKSAKRNMPLKKAGI